MPATCYLLHFLTPYTAQTGQRKHQCRHYLGVTELPLETRLAAHRAAIVPEGIWAEHLSPLLLAAARAGVEWVVADSWECETAKEAYAFRQRLKNGGGVSNKTICSICNPGNRRGQGGRWAHRKQAEAATNSE